MRTIPRNATKKIAEIRETCTVVTDLTDTIHTDFLVNTSELAFHCLSASREARLTEHVPSKIYTITYGGTREVRYRRIIALTTPAPVSDGMEGITYTLPDRTTQPADVWRVFVMLDDDGETPKVMAEIEYDGLEATVPVESLSPERWVWVPTPEYLAEQEDIYAAMERARGWRDDQ